MNIQITSRDLMSVAEIRRVVDCFASPGFMGIFCGMCKKDPHNQVPKAVWSTWSFHQSQVDAMGAGTLGWGIYANLIRPWEAQMLQKAQVYKYDDLELYLQSLAHAQNLKYAVFSEYLWDQINVDPNCRQHINFPSNPFHNYNGTYQLGNMQVSADLTSFLDDSPVIVTNILQPNQVLVMADEVLFNFDDPQLFCDSISYPDDPLYTAAMSFGIASRASIHELDV